MQFECMTKSWISDSVIRAQDILVHWKLAFVGKIARISNFFTSIRRKKNNAKSNNQKIKLQIQPLCWHCHKCIFVVLKPKKRQASIWHWISQTKQQLHFLIKMQFFNRVVQVWIASVFFRSNSDCHEKTQTVRSLKTNVKFQTNKQTNRN